MTAQNVPHSRPTLRARLFGFGHNLGKRVWDSLLSILVASIVRGLTIAGAAVVAAGAVVTGASVAVEGNIPTPVEVTTDMTALVEAVRDFGPQVDLIAQAASKYLSEP